MSSEGKYTNIEYQNFFEKNLSDTDPEIYKAINDELARQQQHIELIASENIVSNALLEAQGSVLTNKYAEGYPGKRYYNGCDHVDVAENLANERLKKLFNCKFANSQPHSGAQANGAVFLALLKPGDTIMGMSLNSGGHLTHGSKASVSGKWFNAIAYDVDKKTELLDYVSIEKLAVENKPKLIIAGGSAYSRQIDFKKFESAAVENLKNESFESSELKKQINIHKSENEGKLILSIDRLDYTKGVVNRLLAFERFLDTYPEYHDKIRLVMLAVPSRSKVPQYMQLKRQTDEVVGRINGKFASVSWTPVWYYYRSMKFENLIDLYTSSDVAMITPLRDGMNLVAKEYLATRVNNDGVLILSELAGSSKELPQALLVNPFDIEQLSQSIKTAVEMPLKEQKERNTISRKRIQRYDIDKWSSNFMNALDEVANKESSSKVRLVNDSVSDKIVKAYKVAKKKLLLLDYDGTLVDFKENPSKAIPNMYLLDMLDRLSNQKDTDVVIISGRPHEFLNQYFAHLNITLVAEHGLFLKNPASEWQEKKGMSDEWKEYLLPVLDTFTDNTPGTFIEQKTNSLVWHYRKADPELGTTRSVELKTVLSSLLPNGLTLLDGNKVLELVPSNINKGIVALDLFNSKSYDFVFVAGDDVTDENMFLNLPSMAYKVKIGKKKTVADYFFRNNANLLGLLNKFE